jgi:hypothetical protein
MGKLRTKWLDRRIAAPGPYLTLCLSQEEFDAVIAENKTRFYAAYVNAGADATTHVHSTPKGTACIVCLSDYEGRSPIEVAGLLVHEAVHVWQEYAASIGERCPGVEQEAYAVQSIAQDLMAEFARRMNEG